MQMLLCRSNTVDLGIARDTKGDFWEPPVNLHNPSV